jgi:hypothetical protein
MRKRNWKDGLPLYITNSRATTKTGAITMSKYEPLGNHLAALPATQDSITLSFDEIEQIIGAKLPRSATEHREWWANQEYGSRAPHWQKAGFKLDRVDQQRGIATFRRNKTARRRSSDDKALEDALREINRRAGAELSLGSGRFTTLLNNRGGIGAAQYSLRPQSGSGGGFDTIMAAGRPDLTLEYVVLQERFRGQLDEPYLTEARRRLGWLESPEIPAIAAAIEAQAPSHEFGGLQAIRQQIKGLERRSHTIFKDSTIKEHYAFHYGGRTELQFNIGFEEAEDGERYLRHGLAISLKRDASMTEITDEMLKRIARLNEFIGMRADEYTDFLMYNAWYDSEEWSGDHALRPIEPEIVKLGAFIFVGRRQNPEKVSIELILRDFDRLLPIYEFAEGGDTEIQDDVTPPEFEPGLSKKASRTTMSATERKLNRELRHNDIQHALGQYLVKQYGKDAVRDELPTGYGTKIDLVVEHGDEYTYYEIKVGESALHCIRQALGQLCEYAYCPPTRRVSRLVIIGEKAPDRRAKCYMEYLSREFDLPLYYEQFDMDSRKLIG